MLNVSQGFIEQISAKVEEQAAEIERLRAVIESGIAEFEYGPPNVSDTDCWQWVMRARAALSGEKSDEG